MLLLKPKITCFYQVMECIKDGGGLLIELLSQRSSQVDGGVKGG